MIKSMTGYSKSQVSEEGINVSVELKSLNGRYLDINCKLPRHLAYKELELREKIKLLIPRGTVSLIVNIDYEGNSQPFSLSEASYRHCYEEIDKMRKNLKIKDNIRLEHLLQFSDYIFKKDDSHNEELHWNLVIKALNICLKEIDKFRLREGKAIAKDFSIRIKNIAQKLDKIESISINQVPEERERLRQKIAQLFDSDEIDESRIQMEIVLIADKLDISEECLRLRSHIKYFLDEINSKDSAGRKINFILQEMVREINTIGSKSNNSDISHLVVQIKEELERIREQAQNIE